MRRPWLTPLVPLYRAGVALRQIGLRSGIEPIRHLQWPVISIGNLSAGGSGKTPLAITLVKLLQVRGLQVDILSRGYGRSNANATRVDPDGAAQAFGDEPLLIARATGVPVYVAPRRYDAGVLAESRENRESATRHDSANGRVSHAHILDDGFQHRQLHRDIDILLVDREDWQDSLLPAGNLREALPAAKRADVLAIPVDDAEFEVELRRWGWGGPVWRLHRHMQVPPIDEGVFAFCGIARPEQFFAGLRQSGLRLAGQNIYRDHYEYSEQAADWLVAQAKFSGARALITTEKDAVRLGALASRFPPDLPLLTAPLRIEIEDADVAMDWLMAHLASRSAAPAL